MSSENKCIAMTMMVVVVGMAMLPSMHRCLSASRKESSKVHRILAIISSSSQSIIDAKRRKIESESVKSDFPLRTIKMFTHFFNVWMFEWRCILKNRQNNGVCSKNHSFQLFYIEEIKR